MGGTAIRSLGIRGPDVLVNGTPKDLWGESTWCELQHTEGNQPIDIRAHRVAMGQTYARGWVLHSDWMLPQFQTQEYLDSEALWVKENAAVGIVSSVMAFQRYPWNRGAAKFEPTRLNRWMRIRLRNIAKIPTPFIFEPANEMQDSGFLRAVVDFWVTISDAPVLLSTGRNGLDEGDLRWVGVPAQGNYLMAINPSFSPGSRTYPLVVDSDHMSRAVLQGRPPESMVEAADEWLPYSAITCHMRAFEGSQLENYTKPVNDPNNPSNPLFLQWGEETFGEEPPVPVLPDRIDLFEWMDRHPDNQRLSRNTWWNFGGDLACLVKGTKPGKWDWFCYTDDRIYDLCTKGPNDPEGNADPRNHQGQISMEPNLTRWWPRIVDTAGVTTNEVGPCTVKVFVKCQETSSSNLGQGERYEIHCFQTAADPDGTGQRIGGNVPDDAVTITRYHFWGDQGPGGSPDRRETFIYAAELDNQGNIVRCWGHVRWWDHKLVGGIWQVNGGPVTANTIKPPVEAKFPCRPEFLEEGYYLLGGEPPPPPPPSDADAILEELLAVAGSRLPYGGDNVHGCERPEGTFRRVYQLANELRRMIPE
jgi:hypothetical protein